MVKKYPSMNSTFFVNEWNGKSILGHMLQTNQLNDQKIRMNDIIANTNSELQAYSVVYFIDSLTGASCEA